MNPELRRNLWLELTPHRLWLIPGVLLGIALIGWPPGVMENVALFGMVVFTLIWGPRQAADAIIDEARERTWDIQRMSSLGPWAMTWGKLAGATVMSWYGGLCCMLLYLAMSAPGERTTQLLTATVVLFGAIVTQGMAMIAALLGMHLEHRARSRLSNAVAVSLLALLLGYRFDLLDGHARIEWYGAQVSRLDFTVVSVMLFAVWSIVGAYRVMCMELEVRTRPWLWLAFTVFGGVYCAGFADADADRARCLLYVTGLVACAQSYVAAFAFARNPLEYRRLLRALGSGEFGRALEEVPPWLASAACAVVLGLAALALGSLPEITNERIDNLGGGLTALVLMMLRDVALLLGFSLRSDGRRAAATTLVYIGVLDLLLPALFDQLGWHAASVLVRPSAFASPHAAVAIFACHAALAVAFAMRSWRQLMAGVNRSTDRQS